jgi:exodeoxyribonuclease VII small subunit
MAKQDQDHFNFEKSLHTLEELITNSENGEVELHSMVENYQTGMNLIKKCKAELDKAELEIKEPKELAPFPPTNDA